MKAIRRYLVEEEVEAPPDLLPLVEAARLAGVDVRRLSEAVQCGLLDGYIVAARNPRRGRVQVRRADIETWMRPIILDGQEDGDAANA